MLRTRSEAGSAEATQHFALSNPVRLGLATASLLVLAVTVARWGLFIASATHSIAGRYDFSTYYAAAYALRGSPHANIYDASVLAHAGAVTHVLVNPPLPYTYPPLFAILLSPFTALSFRVLSRAWLFGSAALWLVICIPIAAEIRALLGNRLAATAPAASVSLAGSANRSPAPSSTPVFSVTAVVERIARLRDDPAPLVALAAAAWLCLSTTPAVQTLLLGQLNFLVLLPLAAVPWLTRRGHERWVGVMIAVAAMLKFTPALLMVYLLLRRRWEAAISAVVTLVALAVFSAAVVGPGTFFAMLPQALHVGTGDASLGHNQALFAPLLVALSGSSVASAAQLASRLLLVLLALAFGHILFHGAPYTFSGRHNAGTSGEHAEEQRNASECAAYAVTLCAMLLLSPTAWVHHYVWVLPAAAIATGLVGAAMLDALGAGRAGRYVALLAVVLAACVALGYALPYAWDTQPHPAVTALAGLPLWPLALEMRPLATFALVFVLAAWIAPVPGKASMPSGQME